MTARAKVWLKPTDQMDLWLETQGYYRKHTARDATCLFRAVSEQLFLTQAFHLEVRRQTVDYALMFKDKFRKKLKCPMKEHAERMRQPGEGGGPFELDVMSVMYKRDFILFQDVGKPAEYATNNGFDKQIMLCISQEKHYDSVYTKQHIANSAFCQSLIYEQLYKGVFGLLEVDYAVKKMLHDKAPRYQRDPNCMLINGIALRLEMRDSCLNVKELLTLGVTPFPYKVAKSLDSEIYRNVEYDTWNDYRKGLRYGSRYWSSHELCVGVKCLVKLEGDNVCHAFIQEMEPEKGPVLVFIEELGEKMTVPYESLELLPQPQTPTHATPVPSLKQLRQIQMAKLTPQVQPDSSQPGKKGQKGVNRIKGKDSQGSDTKRKCGNNGDASEKALPTSVPIVSTSSECYQHDLEYQQELYDSYHHNQQYATQSCEVTSSVSADLEEAEGGAKGPPCPPTSLYPPVLDPNNNYHYQLSPSPPAYCTVNIVPTRSVLPDGSDLPMTDVQTLRYFYNLGLDYMRMNYVLRPTAGTPTHCYPVIQSPTQYVPEPAHVSFVSYEQPQAMPATTPDAVPVTVYRPHTDMVPSNMGGLPVASEAEASKCQSPTRPSIAHTVAPRFKNKRKNGNQSSSSRMSPNGAGQHAQNQNGGQYKGPVLVQQPPEMSAAAPVGATAPPVSAHYVPVTVPIQPAYSPTTVAPPTVFYHPLECEGNYCQVAAPSAGPAYLEYNVYEHPAAGLYPAAVYAQPTAPSASYISADGVYYQPIVQPTAM